MKRQIFVFILFVFATSMLMAEKADETDTHIFLDTEAGFRPGLLYNRNWDPGYNRGNFDFRTLYQRNSLIFGAGAELGTLYAGLYVLFPLEIGVVLTETEKIRLEASASLLPGILLHRPTPYFLLGAEAAGRFRWLLSDALNVFFSLGPRFLTSPDYGSSIAPMEMIDIHIRLGGSLKLKNSD